MRTVHRLNQTAIAIGQVKQAKLCVTFVLLKMETCTVNKFEIRTMLKLSVSSLNLPILANALTFM